MRWRGGGARCCARAAGATKESNENEVREGERENVRAGGRRSSGGGMMTGKVGAGLSAAQVSRAVAEGGRLWGTKQRRERTNLWFSFGFLLVTTFPAIID